ncbi:U1 small nuclear ribonucleoprotein [Apodospora peruviana]|uniref:U1 small nuclear ribonucleoprotein C n=1 Tax=Apodospora peruviana TaxID=516989 RepID=A0AAE0IJ14_9PEZI|nr:U1 small nuclear ribonucleoprotein [Apodospora peruviana]
MPKFFCDYCDVYLTHDSMSVRKAHNSGRNHLRNVVDYYQRKSPSHHFRSYFGKIQRYNTTRRARRTEIGHEKAQSVIDSITSSYAAEGQAHNNPMLPQNAGGVVAGLHPAFPPPGAPPFNFPGGIPPPFPGMPGAPPPPFGMPGVGAPGAPGSNMRGGPPPGMPPFPMPGMPGGVPPNFGAAPGGGMPPVTGPGGLPFPPPPGGLPFPPPGAPNFPFPPPGAQGGFPPMPPNFGAPGQGGDKR